MVWDGISGRREYTIAARARYTFFNSLFGWRKAVKRFFVFVLILLGATGTQALCAQKKGKVPQQREVKIQKTSLTKQQEEQLGKEAAAEVERTTEVIHNPAAEAWLNRIGQRLAKTPEANAYPYYFKLVNDQSINAFALPGGPMFVHTGLIDAADNEDQVAGVLAHEMSHVALRHGANQMSKQQTWQTIMGVVGAAAGMTGGGECGLLCQAIQMGGGLTENAVLMRFSRDHERDADLNGARMMAAAGYNPLELAHFFEKIQAEQGTSAAPKGLASFLSDHPNPGNRIQYIEDDIQFYPKRQYNAATGEFTQIKQIVEALPPPKKKPGALLQPVQGKARQGLPSGYKDLETQGFAIGYPGTWQAGAAQTGGSIFVVPQGGAAKSQTGGVELILGAMLDYYEPKNGKPDLQASTAEYLQSLKQGDSNMRLETPKQVQLAGKPGLMTKLTTKTSNQAEPDQVVYLYTAVQGDLLFSLAVAAPPSKLSEAEPVFNQMIGTLELRN
jgi:Zn-dependent protease with chaperone function